MKTCDTSPGSVIHEAIQFLRSSDLQEVTTAMLSAGLGRPAKHLAQQLAPALQAGLLARRVDGGFAFWRLGPNIDREAAPVLTQYDIENQRVVKVSALAAPSIFAYADQRQAAPFAVSLYTDGRMSLERHGRLLVELTGAERQIMLNAAAGSVRPRDQQPKRVYVAGPMTGMPELNFPAFHAEANRLRNAGYEVANPAEINPDIGAKWQDCMRADIEQLVRCDAIVLLPGWEKSRGATLEHHIAKQLDLEIYLAGELLRQPKKGARHVPAPV